MKQKNVQKLLHSTSKKLTNEDLLVIKQQPVLEKNDQIECEEGNAPKNLYKIFQTFEALKQQIINWYGLRYKSQQSSLWQFRGVGMLLSNLWKEKIKLLK